MTGKTFTLGELAKRVTGGNLRAMAKLANDAGGDLDELHPTDAALVAWALVVDLYAAHAGDRVGRVLAGILREGNR